MPLLHPGDAAHIPQFITPERAALYGPIVERAYYGPFLRAELLHGESASPAIADPETHADLLSLQRHAAALLGLADMSPPHVTSTFQSAHGRKFAWHRDTTNDIRLLVNVNKEETRALLAPMEESKGDVYLGYDPKAADIMEITLLPGDAYALDNRTGSISQMPHATYEQPGRKMLAFEFTPNHGQPLEVDPGVTVIRGLRQA